MKTKETQDIRSQLLRWLQPLILGLLIVAFVFTIRINPKGSYERNAYSLLIGLLAIINGKAFYASAKGNHRLSSSLTIILSLIGSWGAVFIDSRYGITEFFPLIYVTLTVLFSSVLLSLPVTITIAAIQLVALTILVFQFPALMAHNWPSFISYVLFTSVISIVANYIISHQLKLFRESSIRDHLTGLLNRRYFDATLEEKIHRGLSKEYTYGVMLMDIDNFKFYNDRYNHATGDEILQRIGMFLQESTDLQNVVCRHGGDEFAIIVPNTNQIQLYHMADKLRTDAKDLVISDICRAGERLSLSIGLALFPENGLTAEDIMAHADRNLMMAKEMGKDRVMVQ
ncbi:MAG: GGDEF domain-containing protein [Sphaerochaeta sp.]|nr:GGDEF domain-containing protein [Sphaerochaeta sp.]